MKDRGKKRRPLVQILVFPDEAEDHRRDLEQDIRTDDEIAGEEVERDEEVHVHLATSGFRGMDE